MPARRLLSVRDESRYGVTKVFIGVDPHKLSATIEVVDDREKVLATGRFATDKAGYVVMLRHVADWSDRVFAVEGSNGAADRLRNACWLTASTWSTCRPSCQPD
jgi:hypothetical protein